MHQSVFSPFKKYQMIPSSHEQVQQGHFPIQNSQNGLQNNQKVSHLKQQLK